MNWVIKYGVKCYLIGVIVGIVIGLDLYGFLLFLLGS